MHTKYQKTFSNSFSRSLPNTEKWDNFLENALWKMNNFLENINAKTNRTQRPTAPNIKTTTKQPPNQHPKPPKHLASTGKQSPTPTENNPRQAKPTSYNQQQQKTETQSSSQRCCCLCHPLILPSLSPTSAVIAALKPLN